MWILLWVMDMNSKSHIQQLESFRNGLSSCESMQKTFLELSGLESHQSKAHVVKIISHFKCHFCEYTSMNKYYMTDHIRRQHAGEGSNSFVCNKCYTRKQNEHLLRKHQATPSTKHQATPRIKLCCVWKEIQLQQEFKESWKSAWNQEMSRVW